MGIADVLRKRQRLTISLAVLGFVVAGALWGYSELGKPSSALEGLVSVILCPPSLLSIPLIDVEPGSSGYTAMWTVFAFMNSALYAGIGALIGKSRWKIDE